MSPVQFGATNTGLAGGFSSAVGNLVMKSSLKPTTMAKITEDSGRDNFLITGDTAGCIKMITTGNFFIP